MIISTHGGNNWVDAAAVAFYTCIPIPGAGILDFRGVARLAPVVD